MCSHADTWWVSWQPHEHASGSPQHRHHLSRSRGHWRRKLRRPPKAATLPPNDRQMKKRLRQPRPRRRPRGSLHRLTGGPVAPKHLRQHLRERISDKTTASRSDCCRLQQRRETCASRASHGDAPAATSPRVVREGTRWWSRLWLLSSCAFLSRPLAASLRMVMSTLRYATRTSMCSAGARLMRRLK